MDKCHVIIIFSGYLAQEKCAMNTIEERSFAEEGNDGRISSREDKRPVVKRKECSWR